MDIPRVGHARQTAASGAIAVRPRSVLRSWAGRAGLGAAAARASASAPAANPTAGTRPADSLPKANSRAASLLAASPTAANSPGGALALHHWPWSVLPADERPRRWRPPLRDVCTAAVLTIIAVVAAYGEAHPTDPRRFIPPPLHAPDMPTPALLLVVVAGGVLAWRNLYPRAVLVASTVAIIAYTLPGYINGAAVLLPAVALFALATRLPARRSVVWATAVTLALMGATAVNNALGGITGGSFDLIPANNAVALFAGIAVANRRELMATARRQAAEQADREVQRRIEEERLRIARELHDVVAHTMATITVQAAAAGHLVHDRPDEAVASIQTIRAASKDGLRELRAILNVLRNAGEPDSTAPAPGLGRLDALVDGVRAAGLPVTVTVTGLPRELPAITDLAAFRIIQEALTNTLRHAGPATARVAIAYAPDSLYVEVTDTGLGPQDSRAGSGHPPNQSTGYPPNQRLSHAPSQHTGRSPTQRSGYSPSQRSGYSPRQGPGYSPSQSPGYSQNQGIGASPTGSAGAGHGLRGMRERAAAAGGTMEIGAAPGGGFRVAASLPLDPIGRPAVTPTPPHPPPATPTPPEAVE